MNLIYSTPTRIPQHAIYSASNSPKVSFPFIQKPSQIIRPGLYYSPNVSHTVPHFQRNPSASNINSSENQQRFYQSADPAKDLSHGDFSIREEQYIKKIDYMRSKMEEVLKENTNLNQVVRKFQNGGAELHRSTTELESQINFLIKENERLSNYMQNTHFYKEVEAFNKEKALCQSKIDELHQKLTMIFDDNEKLSSVLKEREEEFAKLQKVYEREARLRSEIEQKYESLLVSREYGEKGQMLSSENTKLKEMLAEQQTFGKDLERKVEILIKENEKLNSLVQQKIDHARSLTENINSLTASNQSLTNDNLKLTEILTLKLKEIEEVNDINDGFRQRIDTFTTTENGKDEIIADLEKKVEILLLENGKLHAIIEEKLREFEGNSDLQSRLIRATEEKNKLQLMLDKKNEAELYWRRKFEEIEGKVKMLFFQTNNH